MTLKKNQTLTPAELRAWIQEYIRGLIESKRYPNVRQLAQAVGEQYTDLNNALNTPPESGKFNAVLLRAAEKLRGLEVESVVRIVKITPEKKTSKKSSANAK